MMKGSQHSQAHLIENNYIHKLYIYIYIQFLTLFIKKKSSSKLTLSAVLGAQWASTNLLDNIHRNVFVL